MKIHNKLDLGCFPSSSSCLPHPFPDGGYQPARTRDRSSLSPVLRRREGPSLRGALFLRGVSPHHTSHLWVADFSKSTQLARNRVKLETRRRRTQDPHCVPRGPYRLRGSQASVLATFPALGDAEDLPGTVCKHLMVPRGQKTRFPPTLRLQHRGFSICAHR